MWYQNVCSASLNFVTIHASDGRTDGQNCDSNTVQCITCIRMAKNQELRDAFYTFWLSWLSCSYKLVKMLSVCAWTSVWMLTRVEHIITAAHRDL